MNKPDPVHTFPGYQIVKHEQKTFASPSKNNNARKDKKKTRKAIAKFFARHAKAITLTFLLSDVAASVLSWFSSTIATEEP